VIGERRLELILARGVGRSDEPSSGRLPLGRITLALTLVMVVLAVGTEWEGVFGRPICPQHPAIHPAQAWGGQKLGFQKPEGCPPRLELSRLRPR